LVYPGRDLVRATRDAEEQFKSDSHIPNVLSER